MGAAEDDPGVLFVCLGNICRSPTAEGVFRALAERAGIAERIRIDSALRDAKADGVHGMLERVRVRNGALRQARRPAASTSRGRERRLEELAGIDAGVISRRDEQIYNRRFWTRDCEALFHGTRGRKIRRIRRKHREG